MKRVDRVDVVEGCCEEDIFCGVAVVVVMVMMFVLLWCLVIGGVAIYYCVVPYDVAMMWCYCCR